MSTYTPQNLLVYCTAYSGAVAGMAISGRPVEGVSLSDYTDPNTTAESFAEEFDTVWGAVAPNAYQADAIL